MLRLTVYGPPYFNQGVGLGFIMNILNISPTGLGFGLGFKVQYVSTILSTV